MDSDFPPSGAADPEPAGVPSAQSSLLGEEAPVGCVEFDIDIGPAEEDGTCPVAYRFASNADADAYLRRVREQAISDVVQAALGSGKGDAATSHGVITPARPFSAEAIADEIARALAPQLRRLVRPVTVPPDDAFVDQDAGLFDREVYLRLVRAGAFPAKTVGKKRIAQWGDVKAAFLKKSAPITVAEPTEDPEADLLNAIRQRAGLAIKGGR